MFKKLGSFFGKKFKKVGSFIAWIAQDDKTAVAKIMDEVRETSNETKNIIKDK